MLVTVEIMHCQDSKTGWNESPGQRELKFTYILRMVRAASGGLHSNLNNFNRFSKATFCTNLPQLHRNKTFISLPLSKWCKWLQHLLWLQIFQMAQKFLKQKSKCLHTSENFANHEVTPFTFTFYFNNVAVLLQNIGSNVNFKNIISTQICSPAT